jgi:predicted amidohydrolase
MHDLTAAAVQFEPVPSDKRANLDKISAFVDQAKQRNVELLVFPECCITGYWHIRNLTAERLRDLAEPAFTGPSSAALTELSRASGMSIGAGFLEIDDGDGRIYNAYAVAMPDGTMQRHRKIHAFEHEAISCGSEFTVFDTPHGCRAGLLICYDVNIVENVRVTALMGAEVLIAPHQTGGCRTRNPHLMGLIEREVWERRDVDPEGIRREILGDKGRGWLMRWLPSRAHDNGLFLIFSNGIGVDDDEIRTGNSMVLDPYGRVLVESQTAGDDMVVAQLCGSLLEHSTGRAWIQARRPELYHALTERTGRERDTRSLKFSE